MAQRVALIHRITVHRSLLVHAMVGGGLVISAGCSATRSAGPIAHSTEEWSFKGAGGSKLSSDHYVLHTTLRSKPLVSAMPGFLEACWRAYAEIVPCENPTDQRLETYLFQTRWQWERFTEEFSPKRAETYKRIRTGGYSERGVTVSHYGSRRSALSVLAHEGLHQYLEVTRGPHIPAWLNEGLACRFEAFDLDADNRPIFKPHQNFLRLRPLRAAVISGGLPPLKDVLATHAGIEIHKPANQVGAYYANAWSLVLYLLQPADVNPYHDGFRLLLSELGSEAMTRRAAAYLATDTDGKMTEGEAVFRAYITDDLDGFKRDYEAFLYKFLGLEA